jgi:hypothetical protein
MDARILFVRNWTIGLLIISITALLGYDLYVVGLYGNEDSISNVVMASAKKYPIIPFLLGTICGHLFWRMEATKENP